VWGGMIWAGAPWAGQQAGVSVPGMICGVILALVEVCSDVTSDTDAILAGGVLGMSSVLAAMTATGVIIGEDMPETRIVQEIE